ncbi:hypothetical protein AB3N59_12850 [Leptospira sp. WS92.C1]
MKNESLYFSVEAEASASATKPCGSINEESIVSESQKKAIQELIVELTKRFKSRKQRMKKRI